MTLNRTASQKYHYSYLISALFERIQKGKEILLIIVGGIFVVESLSVIIQILYFKYTKNKYGEGKRLLRMAPLHHHFELLGWHENHVVIRFWIIGIILALFSLTTFKIQ